MVILQRIEELIDSGKTKPVPELMCKPVNLISDLLESYDEFFSEGSSWCQKPWTGVRNSQFLRSPRRSSKPVPPPRKVKPPIKHYPEGLFRSFQAVQEYYEKHNKVVEVDGLTVSETDMFKYLNVFIEELPYPLASYFECLEEIQNMDALYLWIPHMHGDEDCAGLVQALLTSAEEFGGMLMHHDSDGEFNLTKAQRKVVDKYDYKKLCAYYRDYKGEKVYDLKAFEDWFETYFGKLHEKYPAYKIDHYAIIDYEGGNEVPITSIEDIECALEYTAAYDTMFGDMPNVWQMECPDDDDTSREDFVTELLRVWKEGHKKCKTKSTT